MKTEADVNTNEHHGQFQRFRFAKLTVNPRLATLTSLYNGVVENGGAERVRTAASQFCRLLP